jgi:hypothetical protein
LLVAGGWWWLVAGGWWLVAGGWWLVAGGWWLVAGGLLFPGELLRWLAQFNKPGMEGFAIDVGCGNGGRGGGPASRKTLGVVVRGCIVCNQWMWGLGGFFLYEGCAEKRIWCRDRRGFSVCA